MTKSDILQWFSMNTEALSSTRILFILAVSAAVGCVIFITYRLAYRGVAYNAQFNVSNVVLVLVSAVIMLMISSNIAISLGMVGALSIVRFRTAIKDPQDTVYIFWAVVEGLCIGAEIYKLAVLSTLVVAIVLLCGSYYDALRRKYLIVLHGTGFDETAVMALVAQHHARYRIRSVNRETSHMELVCEVTSGQTVSQELMEALRQIPGVTGANWLLETGGYVG